MGYNYWVHKQTDYKKNSTNLNIDYTHFLNNAHKAIKEKHILNNVKKRYINKSNFKFLRKRERSRVYHENIYNSAKYYSYFVNKRQYLGIDLYDLTNKIFLHNNNISYKDYIYKSFNYTKKDGFDDVSTYRYAADFSKPSLGKKNKIKRYELDYTYIEKERLDDTDYHSDSAEVWLDSFYNPDPKARRQKLKDYREFRKEQKYYNYLLSSFIEGYYNLIPMYPVQFVIPKQLFEGNIQLPLPSSFRRTDLVGFLKSVRLENEKKNKLSYNRHYKKLVNQGIFVNPKHSYLNIIPDQTFLKKSLNSVQTRGPYPASLYDDEVENYTWYLYDDDLMGNFNFIVPDYEINNYLENPHYRKLLASRKNMFYTNSPSNSINFLFNDKKKKKKKLENFSNAILEDTFYKDLYSLQLLDKNIYLKDAMNEFIKKKKSAGYNYNNYLHTNHNIFDKNTFFEDFGYSFDRSDLLAKQYSVDYHNISKIDNFFSTKLKQKTYLDSRNRLKDKDLLSRQSNIYRWLAGFFFNRRLSHLSLNNDEYDNFDESLEQYRIKNFYHDLKKKKRREGFVISKPKYSNFINLDLADYLIAPLLSDQKASFEDLEGFLSLMEFNNRELSPVKPTEPPENAFKRRIYETMTTNVTMMDAINRLYKQTERKYQRAYNKGKKKNKSNVSFEHVISELYKEIVKNEEEKTFLNKDNFENVQTNNLYMQHLEKALIEKKKNFRYDVNNDPSWISGSTTPYLDFLYNNAEMLFNFYDEDNIDEDFTEMAETFMNDNIIQSNYNKEFIGHIKLPGTEPDDELESKPKSTKNNLNKSKSKRNIDTDPNNKIKVKHYNKRYQEVNNKPMDFNYPAGYTPYFRHDFEMSDLFQTESGALYGEDEEELPLSDLQAIYQYQGVLSPEQHKYFYRAFNAYKQDEYDTKRRRIPSNVKTKPRRFLWSYLNYPDLVNLVPFEEDDAATEKKKIQGAPVSDLEYDTNEEHYYHIFDYLGNNPFEPKVKKNSTIFDKEVQKDINKQYLEYLIKHNKSYLFKKKKDTKPYINKLFYDDTNVTQFIKDKVNEGQNKIKLSDILKIKTREHASINNKTLYEGEYDSTNIKVKEKLNILKKKNETYKAQEFNDFKSYQNAQGYYFYALDEDLSIGPDKATNFFHDFIEVARFDNLSNPFTLFGKPPITNQKERYKWLKRREKELRSFQHIKYGLDYLKEDIDLFQSSKDKRRMLLATPSKKKFFRKLLKPFFVDLDKTNINSLGSDFENVFRYKHKHKPQRYGFAFLKSYLRTPNKTNKYLRYMLKSKRLTDYLEAKNKLYPNLIPSVQPFIELLSLNTWSDNIAPTLTAKANKEYLYDNFKLYKKIDTLVKYSKFERDHNMRFTDYTEPFYAGPQEYQKKDLEYLFLGGNRFFYIPRKHLNLNQRTKDSYKDKIRTFSYIGPWLYRKRNQVRQLNRYLYANNFYKLHETSKPSYLEYYKKKRKRLVRGEVIELTPKARLRRINEEIDVGRILQKNVLVRKTKLTDKDKQRILDKRVQQHKNKAKSRVNRIYIDYHDYVETDDEDFYTWDQEEKRELLTEEQELIESLQLEEEKHKVNEFLKNNPFSGVPSTERVNYILENLIPERYKDPYFKTKEFLKKAEPYFVNFEKFKDINEFIENDELYDNFLHDFVITWNDLSSRSNNEEEEDPEKRMLFEEKIFKKIYAANRQPSVKDTKTLQKVKKTEKINFFKRFFMKKKNKYNVYNHDFLFTDKLIKEQIEPFVNPSIRRYMTYFDERERDRFYQSLKAVKRVQTYSTDNKVLRSNEMSKFINNNIKLYNTFEYFRKRGRLKYGLNTEIRHKSKIGLTTLPKQARLKNTKTNPTLYFNPNDASTTPMGPFIELDYEDEGDEIDIPAPVERGLYHSNDSDEFLSDHADFGVRSFEIIHPEFIKPGLPRNHYYKNRKVFSRKVDPKHLKLKNEVKLNKYDPFQVHDSFEFMQNRKKTPAKLAKKYNHFLFSSIYPGKYGPIKKTPASYLTPADGFYSTLKIPRGAYLEVTGGQSRRKVHLGKIDKLKDRHYFPRKKNIFLRSYALDSKVLKKFRNSLINTYRSIPVDEHLRSEIKKDISRVRGLERSEEKKKKTKKDYQDLLSKKRKRKPIKQPFKGFAGSYFFYGSFGFKWSWLRKVRYRLRQTGQDVTFILNNYVLIGLIVWISFLRGYMATTNITSKKILFNSFGPLRLYSKLDELQNPKIKVHKRFRKIKIRSRFKIKGKKRFGFIARNLKKKNLQWRLKNKSVFKEKISLKTREFLKNKYALRSILYRVKYIDFLKLKYVRQREEKDKKKKNYRIRQRLEYVFDTRKEYLKAKILYKRRQRQYQKDFLKLLNKKTKGIFFKFYNFEKHEFKPEFYTAQKMESLNLNFFQRQFNYLKRFIPFVTRFKNAYILQNEPILLRYLPFTSWYNFKFNYRPVGQVAHRFSWTKVLFFNTFILTLSTILVALLFF